MEHTAGGAGDAVRRGGPDGRARWPRSGRSPSRRPGPVEVMGDPPPAPPGRRQPARQRPLPHPAGDHGPGARSTRGRRGAWSWCPTSGPGSPPRQAVAGVRAVLPVRPLAVAGPRRCRARPLDRRAPSSTAHGRIRLGLERTGGGDDHHHRACPCSSTSRASRAKPAPTTEPSRRPTARRCRRDPPRAGRRLLRVPPGAPGSRFTDGAQLAPSRRRRRVRHDGGHERHRADPAVGTRRPRGAPTSTSWCPSTTRWPRSSRASRALYDFVNREFPLTCPDHHRRQREHRRHLGPGRGAGQRARRASARIHLDEKGRGRALRAAWSRERRRRRRLSRRRPVDRARRPAPAGRAAPLGPQRRGHRDPARPRVPGGPRPGPRAHLAGLQLAPPPGPPRPFQRRPVRLQGDAPRRGRSGCCPLVEDEEWFFDTELLVLAERMGLRIHEVPVDWVDDPDSRVDIARTIRDDLRGVWRMLRHRGTGPGDPGTPGPGHLGRAAALRRGGHLQHARLHRRVRRSRGRSSVATPPTPCRCSAAAWPTPPCTGGWPTAAVRPGPAAGPSRPRPCSG